LANGARGQLILSYRPWWLIYGGIFSILCAGFFVIALATAIREKMLT
jgi:hypothetical protein